MSQVNINTDTPNSYNTPTTASDTAGAQTAVAGNLTWAIAVVLIIAALAIAVVYVMHNVHV